MKKFSATRIGGIQILSPARAHFFSSACAEDFQEVAKMASLGTLQSSDEIDDDLWGVQSPPLVERIPSLRKCEKLRRVILENLKGMSDFSALRTAPALEEFALYDGRKQTPDQLLPALKNPHVRRVSAGFGSDIKNKAFAQMREKHAMLKWRATRHSSIVDDDQEKVPGIRPVALADFSKKYVRHVDLTCGRSTRE